MNPLETIIVGDPYKIIIVDSFEVFDMKGKYFIAKCL